MSSTYSYSGDPQTSDKDAIRFILSDKGPDKWLFSDEEILYVMDQQKGSVYTAAAELAMVQGTTYTDKRDKTVGPLSIKYGELSDRWFALAVSLRKRTSGSGGGVRAITTQVHRTPYFRLGGMDIRPPYSEVTGTYDLISETFDYVELVYPESIDGGGA